MRERVRHSATKLVAHYPRSKQWRASVINYPYELVLNYASGCLQMHADPNAYNEYTCRVPAGRRAGAGEPKCRIRRTSLIGNCLRHQCGRLPPGGNDAPRQMPRPAPEYRENSSGLESTVSGVLRPWP
jgi:hypothetical protein